ncbi:MAG: alpha-mannosidase [Cyanobacteria bacterium J06621_3]
MAAIETESPLSTTLTDSLHRLRQLNTRDIQSSWRLHHQDIAPKTLFSVNSGSGSTPHLTDAWNIAELNNRQHIPWERGLRPLWLYQQIKVPNDFNGYPLSGMTLRLALTWWADDAQIYVDGRLVQSGDLFECFTRICLSPQVTPGDVFRVAIRLVSPGHDDGALVRSQLIYELPPHNPTPEPSFIADELTVLAALEPQSQPQIETALAQLDWHSLEPVTDTQQTQTTDVALNLWDNLSTNSDVIPATLHPFQQSLSQLRRTLKAFSPNLKRRQIQCIGHAHLDMAWLWPIADTWEAAERTFQSVIELQKDFPELTYTHSSPALFDWLENNKPELFKQIQQKVADGTWSIDAGLWIEPEFNVISGEAIARQILYGQQYCLEKFGQISTVAWLPDSFGFCWQLPQLLTQGGIETFATLKLSWNDTTTFPHQLFWWESPDGSRILSLMLPPIGTDIDPVKMANHATQWETSTGISNTLWLPGLGDHGGGPTRDMLEKANRLKNSPFFPKINFTNPKNYIQALPKTELPTHKDELYLELHRGCYTTHADQKRQNRRCEDLLYEAEVFATIAYLTANQPYPQAGIDTAWKKLLFNQFHDILPGTSIPEVFVDANRDWAKVKEIGKRVLEESLAAIAHQIAIPITPHPEAQLIIVFNSLSWPRSSVVTHHMPESSPGILSFSWEIRDELKQVIPHQADFTDQTKQGHCQVSFLAKDIPAVGYRCFWLCPTEQDHSNLEPVQDNPPYQLENSYLKATISATTGQITSLIEKLAQKETLSAPGNQLQTFKDQGQYWDAWNIDPNYTRHPLPSPTLESVVWINKGAIRQRIRTIHKFQNSTITQYYTLNAETPHLNIETYIDWQDAQVLLKAYFPLSISSDFATYEIPFGAIARTTAPTTAAEKAKWEVPALTWADLTETKANDTFGTSILTDCKHGFDAGPDYLRLTLLKSPIWPDPNSDKGQHHFTYSIYPHQNTWQTARTTHHARELNIKPSIHLSSKTQDSADKTTPPTHSFLQIHNSNLILSALKPSANNLDEIILRYYEAQGEPAITNISTALTLQDIENAKSVNIVETAIDAEHPLRVTPWQVKTNRLTKNTNPKT